MPALLTLRKQTFTGTLIHLDGAGPTLRFQNVNGGSGGAARIAIRYLRRYGNTTAELRVNGSAQPLTLLRQYPDNWWQLSGWRWLTVDVSLQPGATNTVELVRTNEDFAIDTLTVSTADDLVAAQPHRTVLNLWIEEYLANLGPNDRGFNDDPDGDGLTNIQEYLFGGDPTSDSHSVLPRMINSNGNLLYQVIINPET